MINAFIVVWRESLEAFLVIGVLQAWIAQQGGAARLRGGLWLGVAAGAALAALLGVAAFRLQGLLDGQALELFQVGMALLACALIVQMLCWMRRHGGGMRQALLSRAGEAGGVLGLAGVAALAVAREGAETAVFLYGIGSEASGSRLAGLLAAAGLGLLLAVATSLLLARGSRHLGHRAVFRLGEALLLLVAGAMLAHAVDRLIGMERLPALGEALWDSSAWLPDGHGVGRLLADLLGYRARPSGMLLLAGGAFWALSLGLLASQGRRGRGARR